MPKVSSSEAAAFLLCAVITSAPIFLISFNLGAYGDVFYEHLFALWAASIAALLASWTVGTTQQGEVYNPWYGTILLLIPSLWMLDEVLFQNSSHAIRDAAKWTLTTASVFLALPYTLYFVATAIAPDLQRLKTIRLKAALGTIWLVMFGSGLIVGSNNDWFMTCQDFRISGSALPENCWSGGE
ncbi:MAG: hypothetical protein AAF441_15775 [Pseudomonadota bacterium]